MFGKRIGFVIPILFVGILIGLVFSLRFNTTDSFHKYVPVENVVLGSQEQISEKLLQLQNTGEAFIYISEMIVPVVVSIQSTRIIHSSDLKKYHDNDELRDYFKFKIPREYRQRGSGSGIIVSKDGFILTNVHVINEARRLRVILADDREFDGKIVGMDPYTEVAVIKIDADDLPVAKLGDSSKSRVGEWVLAVGNPLELRSTVTAGIISAKNRQIDILKDQYSIENFIQTDAAINPGNSGGALVNLRGEVIGVNTAIATETGYNAGFGFAIPINLAQKIMGDLIRKGKVDRGYLGIAMQNIDKKKAEALGMDHPQGVFVSQVLKGEAADLAGVHAKDVLLKIDGQKVKKSNQVQAIIAGKSAGDRITLTLLRNGKKYSFMVQLGTRKEQIPVTTLGKATESFDHLGLQVDELTLDVAARLNYSGKSGVVVTRVERWSPADEAGLSENDVILSVDNQSVKSENDFYDVIDHLDEGSVVIMTVSRANETTRFFIKIPEKK